MSPLYNYFYYYLALYSYKIRKYFYLLFKHEPDTIIFQNGYLMESKPKKLSEKLTNPLSKRNS